MPTSGKELMDMINECATPVIGVREPAPPAIARHIRHRTDGQQVSLRDGAQVLIRPIRSTDAPLLAEGFDRLSATSRWFRFLAAKQVLTAAELRYFTEIDHHDHEALVAVSAADGRAVGVARYIRCADDRRGADLAVTVIDDWHRRGVATHLLTRLSERAVGVGVDHYTVLVATDNLPVFGLLHSLGLDLRGRNAGFGTVEGEISLPLAPAQHRRGDRQCLVDSRKIPPSS